MSANAWAIGAIPAVTARGEALIAGWVSDCFGLDWRPAIGAAGKDGLYGVWAVTHVPTRRSACFLDCTLEEAQAFVAMLLAGADWNTETATADHSKAFAEVRETFGADNVYRGQSGMLPMMQPWVRTS